MNVIVPPPTVPPPTATSSGAGFVSAGTEGMAVEHYRAVTGLDLVPIEYPDTPRGRAQAHLELRLYMLQEKYLVVLLGFRHARKLIDACWSR